MNALTDLRSRVADALTNCIEYPVDSFEPPGYLLVWGDPWQTPASFCAVNARLEVVAIANRIDIEGGQTILEDLVVSAWSDLTAIGYIPVQTNRPAPFEIGGITYLASRIILNVPIQVGETGA